MIKSILEKLNHIWWYLTSESYRKVICNTFEFDNQIVFPKSKTNGYRYIKMISKEKSVIFEERMIIILCIYSTWYDIDNKDILDYKHEVLWIKKDSNLYIGKEQSRYILSKYRSNFIMNPITINRKNKLSKIKLK